jgi:hypothetical protein
MGTSQTHPKPDYLQREPQPGDLSIGSTDLVDLALSGIGH